MERRKLEQIMMVLLVPIVLLSLLYTQSSKIKYRIRHRKSTPLEEQFPEDKTIDQIPKPAHPLEVTYEKVTKDPLKDLLQVYLYILEKDRPKEIRRTPLPSLNIEGLIWNTDMPQAIINGRVIVAGDTIAGVKVVKIEHDGITVEHEGEAVFVSKR